VVSETAGAQQKDGAIIIPREKAGMLERVGGHGAAREIFARRAFNRELGAC
jgi:hypothetical protein